MQAQPGISIPDIAYIFPTTGVLLFADDPQRRADLAAAIERTGGRIVASGPLADAIGRLDRGGAAKIVVDIGEDGDALDAVLDRLGLRLAAGRSAALVLAPIALLDIVTARLSGPDVDILLDASATERGAALSALLAPPLARVAEDGEAETRRKLAQLSDEVGRIARSLAALSADRVVAKGEAPSSATRAALIRALIRLRRLRGLHFEPALFADPAWDILLDLAAARIEGRAVAVSSLCIAAGVPATTALRWIAQMTAQGLLVRQPDETDGRRVFVGLGEDVAGAMDAYLSAAQRIVAQAA